MDKKLLAINGVFAVFKPAGETSANTVERIKNSLLRCALPSAASNDRQAFKRLARKVKVGHGGTLDPMATGVLVIGLNGGCKRLSSFLSGKKSYVAEARFGEHFDTLDCTGRCVIKDDGWKRNGALERVPDVLAKFCGQPIMQRPPAFSAIHVNGVRAHELARNGSASSKDESSIADTGNTDNVGNVDNADTTDTTTISNVKKEPLELPERPVNVYNLKYTVLNAELGTFRLEIDCGGGCYVRSLIRDIAEAVDSVATMTALKRTQQGFFHEEHCLADFADLDAVFEAVERSEALLK